MKIACLSGKGGAGKTFTAVNLAAVAGQAVYIDCDVEEPNGHLFLKPGAVAVEEVYKLMPEFDIDKCSGCRKCADFCHFHAIMFIKNKPRLFGEVCHSCGGCSMICPESAISEKPVAIGRIEEGRRGALRAVTGILNTGEVSGVPVISEALKRAEGLTVIDCPPGSACSVMESVADADYCIIVAEPTAFGFHNFKMIHELVRLLGRKCGVVINKEDLTYKPLEDYCRENSLPILARIPYRPEIAALISAAEVAVDCDAGVRAIFEELLAGLQVEIGGAV